MHFFSAFYVASLPMTGASTWQQTQNVAEAAQDNVPVASVSASASVSAASESASVSVPGVVQVPIDNFPALYNIFLIKDIPTIKLNINGSDIPAQLDTRLPSVVIGPDCPGQDSPDSCDRLKNMVPQFRRFFRYERFDNVRSLSTRLGRIFYQITFGIGSVQIPQTLVARLVNTTGMYMSVVGLGLGGNEHNSVLGRLVHEKRIQSWVFGLNLPVSNSSSGALTLGGLDQSKFSDYLKRVPVLPASEINNQVNYGYWVNLDSLRLEKQAGDVLNLTQEGERRAVFIDSSRTESILPEAIVDPIWDAFARPREITEQEMSNGEAYFYDYVDMQRLPVDCGLREQNKSLEFNFGEATIRVPYHDLIVERRKKGCYLSIAKRPTHSSPDYSLYSIGRSVMRSAYMVFDQDKEEVWMAQAQDCGSHLTAVTGNVSIGSIQGNCGAVSQMKKRRDTLKNENGRWYDDDDDDDDEDEDSAQNETYSSMWDDYVANTWGEDEEFAWDFDDDNTYSA